MMEASMWPTSPNVASIWSMLCCIGIMPNKRCLISANSNGKQPRGDSSQQTRRSFWVLKANSVFRSRRMEAKEEKMQDKRYDPPEMVSNSRYRNYFPALSEEIRRDVFSRMNELIDKE